MTIDCFYVSLSSLSTLANKITTTVNFTAFLLDCLHSTLSRISRRFRELGVGIPDKICIFGLHRAMHSMSNFLKYISQTINNALLAKALSVLRSIHVAKPLVACCLLNTRPRISCLILLLLRFKTVPGTIFIVL
jgi:hypothetical protein